jgi:5-methyltetrahydrofolate--homocysteine methyltransferase
MTAIPALLDGPLLLDGAMGTALLARGLPPGALPEEWILSRPEEIAAVHAAHAAAGARILLTATFNCAGPRLEARLDPARIEALCGWAERLARGAARGGLVAGSVGPTALVPPLGPGAPASELRARYARPLSALAAAGVDLLWIEGLYDLAELRAALAAARPTGLPAVVTFGFPERAGRLTPPGGVEALELFLAAEAEGAAAAGVNCAFPGPALDALVAETVPRLRIPFVLKPSPGLPGALLAPDAFAASLRPALDAGVRLVGGCCGAGPEHLRALGRLLAARRGAVR